MSEAPRINDDHRREALLKVGHALVQLKNDLAYIPAEVPNSRIRRVMRYGITILKKFQVKTLRLRFADECLDVYPLACLYNLGVQILALRETQNKLKDYIHQWKDGVQAIQASSPALADDIGVVLAETHEFMIFATFANRIHPVSTLTQFSIDHAVRKAQESQFLKEASYVVSVLKAAFSIQKESEKIEISESTYTVSDTDFLPATALHVAAEWYKNYELSIPSSEMEVRQQARLPMIPFNHLLKWFIDARRRILVGTQTVSPALKAIVRKAMATNRQLATWRNFSEDNPPEDNGDRELRGQKPVTILIDNFLDELGEIPGSVPLTVFPVHPDLPKNKSPINFNFQINIGANKAVQQTQTLLKAIYTAYSTASYCCLEIVQRAHWLDKCQRNAYTKRAKIEIESNFLRSVGALVATQRINKICFPSHRVSRKIPIAMSADDPFRSDLLEAIFEVYKDPNSLEEQYLVGITGMNINQIHTWFLYKRHVQCRPMAVDHTSS